MRYSGTGQPGGNQGMPIEATVLHGMNESSATLNKVHIELIELKRLMKVISEKMDRQYKQQDRVIDVVEKSVFAIERHMETLANSK